jgi:RNA polymerase sigma-70 factor (ECF subfamily)
MSDPQLLSLYRAHQRDLVAFAGKIIGNSDQAEDITHEAYLRLSSALAGAETDNSVGYLYRIVRNLALDYCRRHQLELGLFSHSIDEVAEALPEEHPSLDDQAITGNELEHLQAAMNDLPERTRLAVEMHRFGGYKLREIAEHLNISISMAQHLVKEGVKHCQRRCSQSGTP